MRFRKLAVIADVLVERDLLGAVPPAPPALAVAGLVDDDAIDPGAKGRVAAERVDGAEHPQEDLLRQIEGLVMVAQQVERQLVDHPLMLAHQFRAGVFVARGTPLHEGRFAATDVRPGNGGYWLHGDSFSHFTPAVEVVRPSLPH